MSNATAEEEADVHSPGTRAKEEPTPSDDQSEGIERTGAGEKQTAQNEAEPQDDRGGDGSSDCPKQATKAKKIKKNLNIQGQSIFITFQEVEREHKKAQEGQDQGQDSSEKPPSDPTEVLPPRSTEIREIAIEEQGRLLADWRSRRTLLLSSFQTEPAVAVAYSLIQDPSLSPYEKRAVFLERSIHRDRLDLTIELFYRPEILERRQQIVLVEIARPGLFLDSVLRISYSRASAIQKFLRETDSLLVFTVSRTLLKPDDERRLLSRFPLGHYPVQDPDSCEVSRQPEDTLDDLPALGQLIKSQEVFPELSWVQGTVLYTATYFPDLTPHDFERIVLLLLGDDKVLEEAEEQILTEQGEVRTLKKKVDRRLADIWREAPDRILQACRLQATSAHNGAQVMEFKPKAFRGEVMSYLESQYPMFLVRMFERLQAAGLLFDPGSSPDITDNLISLFVKRTLSDPAFCGKDWFFSLMISLQSQTKVEIDPEDSLDKRLFKLLAHIEGERIRQHVLGRLAQLIREMLQHDQLLNVVREFLATLLAAHEHEAALDLLLELTRRLRFAPQFDPLLWFRRLIDQGSEEIRERTFRCLIDVARESGAHVSELLESLSRWLPASELESERYSLSNHSALRFILEFSAKTLADFDSRHFGRWPSRYPLFAALPDDREALCSYLVLLCKWLLHRGMPAAFESWAEDRDIDSEIQWKLWFGSAEEAHSALVADLIEHWVLILEGLEPQNAHPEARRVTTELLATLDRLSDATQRKRFIRRWQERQQQFHLDVNRLSAERREERSCLLAARKKVYELRQRFSALRSSGVSNEGIQ